MGEAIIGVALETLSSLIQNELISFLGVDREMRRLSSVLSTIKAVLKDAEEKRLTNNTTDDWLRKLRDAAYLLDDILDECSTHALSLEYRHKVPGSCLCSLNPSHVMFRYKIAKKLKDISQRLDEIAGEKSKFHLGDMVVHERRNEVMEWRETTSTKSRQFYGREADKEKIVNFLVDEASNLDDVSVYPIIGIGGLGKTALAQQVFDDERVKNHFDEPRLWVCVSEDFSLKRLFKAIIESDGHNCGDLDLEPLQRQLQEVLGRKRYLLVLDDVWNEDQEKWDRLKDVLACGSKGSSILVTTRLPIVASIMKTVQHPLKLSPLSDDDCWELCRQRAFASEEEQRVELVAIGKEIVKKCKGVPLAAKTLGSLLHSPGDEKVEAWLRIKDSELWNLPQGEGSILPALRLSYLNLPAKVKQCFAYLAVFPKDERMSKEQVIQLWMANGFISTTEGCDAEVDGDRVWNELYLKSLFEDVEIIDYDTWWGTDKIFKMHDLVHDLAQLVMEEECCSMTFKNSPPGDRTHHLLIYYGDEGFNERWSSYLHRVKSLKSLIILGTHEALTACDLFLQCYSLRVLNLEDLKQVPSSIEQLKYLRYLNLSHGHFTTLPDSICRLWNLQTLNLFGCESLKTLPNQLKCLRSLRHLHLKGCRSLSRLAPNMGKLTCLKTLTVYIVGVQKGFLLEEVGNLKLGGTLHIKHLERVGSEMDAKTANLADKRLYKLGLSWERNEQCQLQENDEKILEVLQPHKQLKTLVMGGYLGAKLPQWMFNLTLKDLRRLELKDCENLLCISSLAKLPSLKSLILSNIDQVQYINDESYADGFERGFQALEDLGLERLPSLIKLSREDGDNMFPLLSKLEVTDCQQLNLPFIPSVTKLSVIMERSRVFLGSIQNLPNLEHLKFSGDTELTSFPDEMFGGLGYLRTLIISSLPKLEVFPTGLANLKALEDLTIMECNSLETITEEALQGLCSLKTFTIWFCRKFKLSAGFRHLVALEFLSIVGCGKVEDLHDALQHIMSLRFLNLLDLPNLASLPDWLGNLRLLKALIMYKCPKLMSLPMSTQSLTNLKYLSINGCPELGKRCKEETGEDWPKISHVLRRDIQH